VLQITRVLTATSTHIPESDRVEGVDYRHLRTLDIGDQDLLASGLLANALSYIAEAEEKGEKVLVHW